MLSNIANAFGDSVNYDQSTPGGTSLYAHSQNQTTLNKINQQSWDYVVLQDQSQRPSLSPTYVAAASVYPYASQLVTEIQSNNLCSEPLFYMTWGRKYGDQSNCSGSAYNLQLGYMFKNMFSLDARYTHIDSDEFSFLNNGTFYNDICSSDFVQHNSASNGLFSPGKKVDGTLF